MDYEQRYAKDRRTKFHSRLFCGTGKVRKFSRNENVATKLPAAEGHHRGCQARELTDRSKESLLDYIDRERFFLLPNTEPVTRRRGHPYRSAGP